MIKWAFISDFDGTISKKDFYWIIIERYYPEGEALFHKWKAGEMKDIEFLSKVFSSINQGESVIHEDINLIPLDNSVIPFIQKVHEKGGDFKILSAGTDYYIRHLLEMRNFPDVEVISNPGYYMDRNIHLDLDPSGAFYSARYGIDKQKVMQHLRESYDYLFYYGDSEPDSHPAKEADQMFARDALVDILKDQNTPFRAVDSFSDIERILDEEGWPGST